MAKTPGFMKGVLLLRRNVTLRRNLTPFARPVSMALTVVIALTLALVVVASPALALNPQPEPPIGETPIFINGNPLELSVDPVLEGTQLLVPGTPLGQALGATAQWNALAQSLSLTKGGTTLFLQAGSKVALKNGSPLTLAVAPKVVGGQLLVPLETVTQVFGAKLTVDAATGAYYVSPALATSLTPPVFKTLTVLKPSGLNLSSRIKLIFNGVNQVTGGHAIALSDPEVEEYIVEGGAAQAADPPAMVSMVVPIKLDYSKYVTLTQNQDGWSGTLLRAITQTMTILKEMEHPYTPDLSNWYLDNEYDKLFWPWYKAHPMAPPDYWPHYETTIVEEQGIASETSLPSNYDLTVKTTLKDPYGNPVHDVWGNPIYYWDTSLMPQPTAAVDQDAALYRVKSFSDPVKVQSLGVDGLKELLQVYGPVVAGGPLPAILGNTGQFGGTPGWMLGSETYANNLKRACVTVVGYDNFHLNPGKSLGAFKLLGSWGDRVLENGYFYLPYESLENNLIWARYFENKASDRTGTASAFTARIAVSHEYRRAGLRVRVGVVGKAPLTVWDQPNKFSCPDTSRDLVIDVPLPAYAATAWPPGSGNQWYVEVESLYGTAKITEFTLARLVKRPNNLSIGRYETETYRPADGVLPIDVPDDGTPVKVLVPAVAGPSLLIQANLTNYTLTVAKPTVPAPPGQVVIAGTLGTTKMVPMRTGMVEQFAGVPSAEIRLYELDQNACVNLPSQWSLVGKATTDAGGNFNFKPSGITTSRHIYAVAYMGAGEAIRQSSAPLIVDYGTTQNQWSRPYLDLPELTPLLSPGFLQLGP